MRSGIDADSTGAHSWEAGRCSECGELIPADDLDRQHKREEEQAQLQEYVAAARCPCCHEERPMSPWGYVPARPLRLMRCLHYACPGCARECDGCHLLWCRDCVAACPGCGRSVCWQCAIECPVEGEKQLRHAACVPLEVAS